MNRTVEGSDDRDPIQKFLDYPSNWAGGKFPKPSRVRAEDPCRNCDAIECGDESWPRPICCDGCTHGR